MKLTVCTFYNNELVAVNGVLQRESSQAGLKTAIDDIEKMMRIYRDVGAMDSEAERCLQVSMIYTHLTGNVHRQVSWGLFDTHKDFLEAHERLDNVLSMILGIIYQRSFMTKKRRKKQESY